MAFELNLKKKEIYVSLYSISLTRLILSLYFFPYRRNLTSFTKNFNPKETYQIIQPEIEQHSVL